MVDNEQLSKREIASIRAGLSAIEKDFVNFTSLDSAINFMERLWESEAMPLPAEASRLMAEAAPVEEEEIPAWLRILREEGLEEPSLEEVPTPAEAAPIEKEEIPVWLRKLRLEPEAPPTPVEAEASNALSSPEPPPWPEAPPTPVEAEAPALAVAFSPGLVGPTPSDSDMSGWYIGMSDDFIKSLRRIDKKLMGRILEAVLHICREPTTPRGNTVKPLTAESKGLWRYRIGDFRLVYHPDVVKQRVTLLMFGSRAGVYQ